jgi:hypothetical protein
MRHYSISAQIVPSTKADSALMKMRAALRWVATAQRAYFSETGGYADSYDALRPRFEDRIDAAVGVKFLRAAKDGWAAEDTKAAFEERPSERPGRAVCDLDPS